MVVTCYCLSLSPKIQQPRYGAAVWAALDGLPDLAFRFLAFSRPGLTDPVFFSMAGPGTRDPCVSYIVRRQKYVGFFLPGSLVGKHVLVYVLSIFGDPSKL